VADSLKALFLFVKKKKSRYLIEKKICTWGIHFGVLQCSMSCSHIPGMFLKYRFGN
jgi:hypothetical protein